MDKTKTEEKRRLMNRLLDAVKQCQIRFGGKTELATESDSRVIVLCSAFEAVLQHGMKHNSRAISTLKQLSEVTGLTKITAKISLVDDMKQLETEPVFWHYVKEHMSRHELQRYMILKNVSTDAGRSLAWLRSALNEHSLERYVHMMINSDRLLSQYYEDWAFLRDSESAVTLPNMAAGLDSILFAINIDNPDFNIVKPAVGISSFFPFTNQPASQIEDKNLRPTAVSDKCLIQDETKKEKKKKKKPAKIITFDDSDLSSCSASPASDRTTFREPVPVPFQPCHLNSRNNSVHLNHGQFTDEAPPSSKSTFCKSASMTQISTNMKTKQLDNFLCDRNVSKSSNFENFENQTGNSKSSNEPDSDNSNCKNYFPNKDSTREYLESAAVDGEEFQETKTDYLVADLSDDISFPLIDNFSNELNSNKGSNCATLRHSQSAASMASSSNNSTQGYCLRSDGSSGTEISLIPLNEDGKPIDLDSTNGMLDGDTASESCGSCMICRLQPVSNKTEETDMSSRPLVEDDSREMQPYGEMMQQASQAVAKAEQALQRHNHYIESLEDGQPNTDRGPPVSDGLSADELKQAVVAMMLCKDELQEQNRRLLVALDGEKEIVSSLRSELEDKHRAELSRQEKSAERNRNLMRENELLKHQLKKYVSAVQMLRWQGANSEDLTGIHLEESVQPVIPPTRSSIDYSFEASEFEKKLIQVAEMHGELMEFNEVLQRQLLARESQLKQVTEELISLRGPLPTHSSHQTTDHSNMSVELPSDFGGPVQVQPLVNIWIPSAFLRGTTTDAYHVYQVYIRIRDEEWNVYRRYAEFYELHMKLKKRFHAVNGFDFPPKKTFGKKDPKIVEIRRKKLESYLRRVISLLVDNIRELAEAPSRQTLLQAAPFFSNELRPQKNKRRTRRTNEDHPTSTGRTTQPGNVQSTSHYMGL